MKKPKTNVVKTTYLSLISLAFVTASQMSHAESVSPEEAHSIGVDAYLSFFRS